MKTYSLWISGIIAIIGSLVVNAVIDTLAFPFTGVPKDLMTFKVAGPVGMFTLVGVIGAIIVFAIVRRFARNPNSTFTWIAVVVLVISFLPDIFVNKIPNFPYVTPGGIILLIVLHIACAVVTVTALTKLTKPVVRY